MSTKKAAADAAKKAAAAKATADKKAADATKKEAAATAEKLWHVKSEAGFIKQCSEGYELTDINNAELFTEKAAEKLAGLLGDGYEATAI